MTTASSKLWTCCWCLVAQFDRWDRLVKTSSFGRIDSQIFVFFTQIFLETYRISELNIISMRSQKLQIPDSRLSGKQKDKTSKIQNQKSVENIYFWNREWNPIIKSRIGNRDRDAVDFFWNIPRYVHIPQLFLLFFSTVTQYFRCHHVITYITSSLK